MSCDVRTYTSLPTMLIKSHNYMLVERSPFFRWWRYALRCIRAAAANVRAPAKASQTIGKTSFQCHEIPHEIMKHSKVTHVELEPCKLKTCPSGEPFYVTVDRRESLSTPASGGDLLDLFQNTAKLNTIKHVFQTTFFQK